MSDSLQEKITHLKSKLKELSELPNTAKRELLKKMLKTLIEKLNAIRLTCQEKAKSVADDLSKKAAEKRAAAATSSAVATDTPAVEVEPETPAPEKTSDTPVATTEPEMPAEPTDKN